MRGFVLLIILSLLLILVVLTLTYQFFFPNSTFDFNMFNINFGTDTTVGPVQTQSLSQDAAKYFGLKNKSCEFLSGNILFVTKTNSVSEIHAIKTTEEQYLADYITCPYNSDITDKLYIYNNQTKYVSIDNGTETTIIWKMGRLYACAANSNCTMHLMDDIESKKYADELFLLRTGCAYFGNTNLPKSIDTNKLFQISSTGSSNFGDYTCDNFLISANRTYASQILAEQNLTEDQTALVWAAAHFNEPVQECLDQATGIIVFRNMAFDLTHSYLFDYELGGYMHLTQQTKLVYLQKDIPEEFLRLPN